MKKFIVYSKGVEVGFSELEHGDPPMRVAFGVFYPTSKYSEIREDCMGLTDKSHLELSVKTASGVALVCAGVGILDSLEETEASLAEVTILGISYPPYEELFPEHAMRYQR